MGLTTAQKQALNVIESAMARKGFALGDILDTIFTTIEGDVVDVEKGVLNGASTEISDTDAAAIDLSVLHSIIESAGAESRTLAAPGAGEIKLKVITMGVDNGDVTILADNVLGFTTENFTFNDVGDTTILFGVNQKWVIIGGNVTPA